MKIPADPDHDEYVRKWASLYGEKNYDGGLTGFCLRKSHEVSEMLFPLGTSFEKVLEVGAGTGEHFQYVRHSYKEYWMTDLNSEFLDRASFPRDCECEKLFFRNEDASHLTFPDNSFDRVIAAHILEHLSFPHVALREWVRVLRPGGTLTLVLPCDPGCAWRLGRALIARKKFLRSGIDYDYWMAREHVNPINNLVSFVRFYFRERKEIWWPFRVPSMDVNLFFVVHAFLGS